MLTVLPGLLGEVLAAPDCRRRLPADPLRSPGEVVGQDEATEERPRLDGVLGVTIEVARCDDEEAEEPAGEVPLGRAGLVQPAGTVLRRIVLDRDGADAREVDSVALLVDRHAHVRAIQQRVGP